MERIFLATAIFLLPLSAFAQVSLSEIMYDLDGGDTDREWIEIFNEGSAAVDLSTWKLFEAESNHKLTLYRGEAMLTAGGYAVIATKPETFLKDWPSFAGTLFGSSFSLKNTGEQLVLRDSALKDSDSVTYTPDWGAKGDGNSLQKAQGKWSGARPTPGVFNVAAAEGPAAAAANVTGNEALTTATPSSQEAAFASAGAAPKSFLPQPQLRAVLTVNSVAIAGAGALFRGQGFGLLDKPLEEARYLWNFGDGSFKEGANVSHVYRRPGVYVAVLDVESGAFSASARATVSVVAADLSISSVVPGEGGFVEMFNKGNQELDLSSWQIKTDDSVFVFPKNTFLLSGKRVVFGNEATGLPVQENSAVVLLYPNGDVAYRYERREEGASPLVVAPLPAPAQVSEVKSTGASSLRVVPSAPKKVSEKYAGISSGPDSFYSTDDVSDAAPDTRVSGVTATEAEAAGEEANASVPVASRSIPYRWLLAAAGLVLLGASAVVGMRAQAATDITIIE